MLLDNNQLKNQTKKWCLRWILHVVAVASLVDKPEGSVSIARDTTFDSAIGCSTSNGCDCVGCSDLTQPTRPLDVSKSKCIQSHLSKERLYQLSLPI